MLENVLHCQSNITTYSTECNLKSNLGFILTVLLSKTYICATDYVKTQTFLSHHNVKCYEFIKFQIYIFLPSVNITCIL